MNKQYDDITFELNKAMANLEEVSGIRIQLLKETPDSKQQLGELWESFLSSFFTKIRENSKESGINLLHFISFSNIRKH